MIRKTVTLFPFFILFIANGELETGKMLCLIKKKKNLRRNDRYVTAYLLKFDIDFISMNYKIGGKTCHFLMILLFL